MTRPDTLVVRTTSGPFEGAVHEGVVSFKGIPFAAPPTGGLRFMPPRPPIVCDDVRPALAFGPVALQPRPGGPHR